jgi:hypothetical protein
MSNPQFLREQHFVQLLLDRLGMQPDRPLEDPNADGRESGADVTIILGGRRIGVQVSEIETSPVSGAGRSAEMKKARAAGKYQDGQFKPYAGWAENDPAKLVAAIAARLKDKALKSTAGFDETWLLLVGGIPQQGATVSTLITSATIPQAELDAATRGALQRSVFGRAFIVPVLNTEIALITWDRGAAGWSKNTAPDPVPSYRFDELKALMTNEELLSDPDGWAEREARKVLEEMRGAG